ARKMTFRALYRLERRNLLDCPILGVASDEISVGKLVGRARGGLNDAGEESLVQRARVAVEKPFGHDLDSACELNARLHAVLNEDQILRVDHFLGKQPVVELECLRFANQALAAVWDRHSVSAIQITMAENFGV